MIRAGAMDARVLYLVRAWVSPDPAEDFANELERLATEKAQTNSKGAE